MTTSGKGHHPSVYPKSLTSHNLVSSRKSWRVSTNLLVKGSIFTGPDVAAAYDQTMSSIHEHSSIGERKNSGDENSQELNR